jgi:hypothetical protein
MTQAQNTSPNSDPLLWWGYEAPRPGENDSTYMDRFRSLRHAGQLVFHAFAANPGQGSARTLCGRTLAVFASRTRMRDIEQHSPHNVMRVAAGLLARNGQQVCPDCRAQIEMADQDHQAGGAAVA